MNMRCYAVLFAISTFTFGCANDQGSGAHVLGMSYPLVATAAVLDAVTDDTLPNPEAQYAETPPCYHPGDSKTQLSDGTELEACSRKNEIHVSYWTARPDRYQTACKGQKGYCNVSIGMVPHCHGYGQWRFCHAHPGGDNAHDHIVDREFASN